MYILKSKSKIWERLYGFILAILFLTICSQFISFSFANWKILVVMSVVLVLVFLSEKKIEFVSVDTENFTIQYVKLFTKREYKTSRINITLNVVEKTTFRGGKHSVLQVFNNGELIIEIDERDGFKKKEFDLFISSFNDYNRTSAI